MTNKPDRWFLETLETALRCALPSAQQPVRYGARCLPLSASIDMTVVQAWLDGNLTVVKQLAEQIAAEITRDHNRGYVLLECRAVEMQPERRFQFWITTNPPE